MMENRPTGTQVQRSGIIGEDHLSQKPRDRAWYSLRLQSSKSGFHYGSVSMGVAKSARWGGLTFDTKGENII